MNPGETVAVGKLRQDGVDDLNGSVHCPVCGSFAFAVCGGSVEGITEAGCIECGESYLHHSLVYKEYDREDGGEDPTPEECRETVVEWWEEKLKRGYGTHPPGVYEIEFDFRAEQYGWDFEASEVGR